MKADGHPDSMPCGLLTLAPNGTVLRANRRFAEWVGVTTTAPIGKRLTNLLSVPSRIFYETNISPLLRMQGFVDEIAMDFLGIDGAKVQCLVNAVEQRDSKGEQTFTHFAIFRATERRRYERDLVETRNKTERLAAAERETSELREQFIAVLGHDLRNPLASISSGVHLLTDREKVSPRGRQILALMQGSVMRAAELIDNVLDFARGRLGGGLTLNRDALAPLAPVLEQVIAEIISASPESLIITEFAIDDPVDCDRMRMGQLLSNLLGNAVTHGAKDQPIRVYASSDDDLLTLVVANGGHPIDAVMRERLFQPFFRGDVKPNQVGLGLGLHIASEIAKAHGGTLSVASDETETSFTCVLPLKPVVPSA